MICIITPNGSFCHIGCPLLVINKALCNPLYIPLLSIFKRLYVKHVLQSCNSRKGKFLLILSLHTLMFHFVLEILFNKFGVLTHFLIFLHFIGSLLKINHYKFDPYQNY
jgi:hypothetical protein